MSNIVIKALKNGQIAIKAPVKYASVHKPNTKFDANGVYEVTVDCLDESAKDELDALFTPIIEAGFEEVCKKDPKMKKLGSIKSPIAEVYDDEGELIAYKIKPKQKAKTVTKDGKELTFKIKVTDGKGKPMNPKILVGNGSVCALVFEPAFYFSNKDKEASVSLRLKEVRVLELVEYGGVSSALDELDDFQSDFDSSGVVVEDTVEEEDVPFDVDEDDLY